MKNSKISINKNLIKVSKTARYFTLGTLDRNTKTIWFVFHGYAQTADQFLESLQSLHHKDTFIIAPEGLSRFYWKDFTSDPVASWMTKLDREIDIEDNHNYLNQLYQSFGFDESSLKFNYLGFSQGTATMSRWIANAKIKVHKLVFYAGDVAHDIDISTSKNFKLAEHIFIYGQHDRFVTEKRIAQIIQKFKDHNLILEIHSFDGKHVVSEEGLSFLK